MTMRFGDQADGLRRLFRAPQAQLVPVAAPGLATPGDFLLDALVGAYLERGLQVLVVDGGRAAKPASELARVNLAACIERLSADVGFLSARGLVGHYLDAQGQATGLLPALRQAAPAVDVILLHLPATELARVLSPALPCRPVLLCGATQAEVTEAYLAMKWLHQRAHCRVFGLLLAAPPRSAVAQRIGAQLADCAERFLGAALPCVASLDPRVGLHAAPSAELRRLARDSLVGRDSESGHHGGLNSPEPSRAWA
ncbi:flagellar biosynthesis protein FlhG [Inhella inkyongensis]|uniref:Flagellar biosynthesis protein FlhG n=1 Tax=Inhella inkyongensis TaxID=392593 RepID=A0A840SAV3_9BURK|nr:flagellar biosynthesis protein [Inhella inkyongensis]MBB5205924.1 flagellar biosynthesis protein FlhG [Inhella inkyongensis]